MVGPRSLFMGLQEGSLVAAGRSCGIRISAANEQAGRQRSRRDDGVCLTTVTGPLGP